MILSTISVAILNYCEFEEEIGWHDEKGNQKRNIKN